MKTLTRWCPFLLLLNLSGCALQPPTAGELAAIPVIEFGNAIPKDSDFVLYFPAGKPIPIVTAIKGSALSQEVETTTEVSLKKAIYAYKEWVSFDGKRWQQGNDVLNIAADIKIPSVQHPEPGLVKLQVDFK